MKNFTRPRLITLLKATAFLLDRPHNPVTGAELMREIGEVTADTEIFNESQRRAFERIKEDLREVGIPIETIDRDGQSTYRIQARQYAMRDLGLSTDEEVVLKLLREVLAGEESFPLRANLGLALQKVSTVTASPFSQSSGQKVISGSPEPIEPRHDPKILDRLVKAGSDYHPVSFPYHSFHSEETRIRSVEPYGFFTRKGIWYLVGRDIDTDGIRVFRVSRITNQKPVIVDTKRSFTIPGGFNLKDYASVPPWNFQFENEERAVTVDIDREEFWRVSLFCQAHGQVDATTQGAVLWNLKVRDFDPLINWMLPFGSAMHPSGPEEFVQRYRAVVREMLAHYGR